MRSLPHPPAGPRHGHLQRPLGCRPRPQGAANRRPRAREALETQAHQRGLRAGLLQNGCRRESTHTSRLRTAGRGRRGVARRLGGGLGPERTGGGFRAGLPFSWRCASGRRTLACARSRPHRRRGRPGAGPGQAPRHLGRPSAGRVGPGVGGDGPENIRGPSRTGTDPGTRTRTHAHTHSLLSAWHTGDIRGLSRASGPGPHSLQLLAGLSQWGPGAVVGKSGYQRGHTGTPLGRVPRTPWDTPQTLAVSRQDGDWGTRAGVRARTIKEGS